MQTIKKQWFTLLLMIIQAVLIGWNHMVRITKGPKNEKETGYYQWNHDQMDSFLDITTFTYHGDRYETADGVVMVPEVLDTWKLP